MKSSVNQSKRREFIQKSLLGTASAGLVVASTSHVSAVSGQQATEPEIINQVDVLVVGSGSAGTTAAIQAGRAGVKTLLMERSFQLGGTTTTGGVAYPGLFDAWGKQVIAGIGWELVKESVELDGGKFPDFSKVPRAHHGITRVQLNQFIFSLLAEEKCREAEVEIAYYEFPTAITRPKRAGRSTVWVLGPSVGCFVNKSSTVPEARKWLECLASND